MRTLVLDTNVVSYLMRGSGLADGYRAHLEGHTLAARSEALHGEVETIREADLAEERQRVPTFR